MSTSINAVLGVAASQIGGRFPGVSPYGAWYGNRHGLVYRTAAFCAMGLSWCFDRVGGLDIFPEHAYTPSGVNWFKAQSRWHYGSIKNIRRGDILFFDFPGAPNRVSHVGIAELDGTPSNRVQTIEFNTSGPAGGSQTNGRMVVRKIRSAYIVGWGRPDYSDSDGAARNWLQRGDSGERVLALQNLLLAAGFNVGPSGADGDFGPATEAAVEAFQESRGLDKDGIVGPQTFAALGEVPAPAAPPAPTFHGTPGVHTGRLTADGNYELVTDGDLGGGSISRWQQIMGTPIDGVIDQYPTSSSLIRTDQAFLNSVVSGGHIANLDPTGRRRTRLDEDGFDDFNGTHTSAVRQFWLRNAVNVEHQKNLIGHPLDFDGRFGPESKKVLQFALNNARANSGRYGEV